MTFKDFCNIKNCKLQLLIQRIPKRCIIYRVSKWIMDSASGTNARGSEFDFQLDQHLIVWLFPPLHNLTLKYEYLERK